MLFLFKGLIRLYAWIISPYFKSSCRFVPTCSSYFLEALELHGYDGLWLGLKRIMRCHPWGGHGLDLVEPPSTFDEGRNE